MTYSGSPYSMNTAMGWVGNVQTDGGSDGDQVNAPDPLWFSMKPHWQTVQACLEGTEYLDHI